MTPAVCAVDVGTTSARAGIFDLAGSMIGRGEAPIHARRSGQTRAEYSSTEIWAAVCASVRSALAANALPPGAIAGIAFDATCSLVVSGQGGTPLSVGEEGAEGWDTIAWFDHRAVPEAAEITASGHEILSSAGGVMSPEMQLPRLLWLKRNLPETWARASSICDLSDFLAMKATGTSSRSVGTLSCKWPYRQGGNPWPRELFRRLELDDVAIRAGLPETAVPVGSSLGPLTPAAAEALGLTTRCMVAAGQVDAYAGALGVLGGLPAEKLAHEAALIAGTSSCVMLASPEPRAMSSVWGPYRDASLPGMWMSEAGQTAAGSLLDAVIRLFGHQASTQTHMAAIDRIKVLRADDPARFAARLHVLPNFLGERSPQADPSALGVISGLSLDMSFDGMCRLYWRTCVALALGIRRIVDAFRSAGRPIDALHVAGGHLKHELLMELYADALDCRIVSHGGSEPVLTGSAMAAAAGAGLFPDLGEAVRAMWRPGAELVRNPGRRAQYDRDYGIFLEMARQRLQIEALSVAGSNDV